MRFASVDADAGLLHYSAESNRMGEKLAFVSIWAWSATREYKKKDTHPDLSWCVDLERLEIEEHILTSYWAWCLVRHS